MDEASRHRKKPVSKLAKAVIAVILIAVPITAAVLISAYLGEHPWISGGAGTPDVILLNSEYRLEKLIAFRKDHRVADIYDGRIIYIHVPKYSGAQPELFETGDVNSVSGAVDFYGNVIVPAGSHAADRRLEFDESGGIHETELIPQSHAVEPFRTEDLGNDRVVKYYDVCGLTLMSVPAGSDTVLGIKNSVSGEAVTLFSGEKTDRGTETLWQLSAPVFYDDIAVVRIYHSDCVYRLVKNEEINK